MYDHHLKSQNKTLVRLTVLIFVLLLIEGTHLFINQEYIGLGIHTIMTLIFMGMIMKLVNKNRELIDNWNDVRMNQIKKYENGDSDIKVMSDDNNPLNFNFKNNP